MEERTKATGQLHEEWAIHDYDDFPTYFGEHPDLDKLVEFAELAEKHGEAWISYASHVSSGASS